MEHRREEPVSGWRARRCTGEVWSPASGWAGLRCLQLEAVGWSPARSLLPPERDRGEGEREQRRNGGRKMMGMFYMVF
jgi:hypothetical protein